MTDTFEPGGTAVLLGPYMKQPEEVRVLKVGRTLVHIERYGQPWAFDKETGVERMRPTQGGAPSRIYTRPQWEARNARKAAVERIRPHFRAYDADLFPQATTDQLERIAAILEEAR